ncbi:ribulose-phosphate 3-epimerase [Parelusimicrobium proximum]|uniref:ribulose-phosphate 3-epimerase n=1 Tax=Parelusimicrobium proximum TaxID=3228953 RepID=UPI003D1626FE
MNTMMPKPDGRIAIAPSILSADIFKLGEQIKEVESAGADWLHVDIMDGHFVPNLSFGPHVVKSIKGKTSLPMDTHLMVEYPFNFVEPFAKAGADSLIIHIESKDDTALVLEKIKNLGLPCGLSIKPNTDYTKLRQYMDIIDIVLVMTVQPGFGGQGYLEEGHENIIKVREMIKESGRKIWLEADGGINEDTALKAVEAGADALVAGNAVFGAVDPAKALKDLKEKIKNNSF